MNEIVIFGRSGRRWLPAEGSFEPLPSYVGRNNKVNVDLDRDIPNRYGGAGGPCVSSCEHNSEDEPVRVHLYTYVGATHLVLRQRAAYDL